MPVHGTPSKRHLIATRNNAGAVGLHLYTVFYLINPHARVTLDEVRKHALVVRARCCTSTKAIPGSVSAGIPGKNASKAAGRSADTYDRKGGSGGTGGTLSFFGVWLV